MIRKIAAILLLCIGLSNIITAQINNKIWNYILQYRDIAISEMKRANIPASITLAQGLLESGIGESRLATEGKNHFGIKCHDWTGPSVTHTDDAPNECFRKYNSAYESYLDHSDFLTGRKRYQVLFTYDRDDYVSWAKGLKSCGYATNPKYAELLIQKIELYYLHIFDKPNWKELWSIVETNRQLSLGQMDMAVVEKNQNDRPEKVIKPNEEFDTSTLPAKVSSPAIKEESANNITKHNSSNVPTNIPAIESKTESINYMQINRLQVVTYTYPVTVADVAAAHQVKIKNLIKYNELPGFATFEANTPIFLQNKKRFYKGGQSLHQVKPKDTIESIAQQYGIKQFVLRKLNLLYPSQEPKADELIFLKKKRKIPPKIR